MTNIILAALAGVTVGSLAMVCLVFAFVKMLARRTTVPNQIKMAFAGLAPRTALWVNGVERQTSPFMVADLTPRKGSAKDGVVIGLHPEDFARGLIVIDMMQSATAGQVTTTTPFTSYDTSN